jgi:hypothetical protein
MIIHVLFSNETNGLIIHVLFSNETNGLIIHVLFSNETNGHYCSFGICVHGSPEHRVGPGLLEEKKEKKVPGSVVQIGSLHGDSKKGAWLSAYQTGYSVCHCT